MSRGEILAYTWDFGDGDTAAGEVVDHTFAKPGEHTVELAVVDSNGRTAETEVTFIVGERASESDRTKERGRARSATNRRPAEGRPPAQPSDP